MGKLTDAVIKNDLPEVERLLAKGLSGVLTGEYYGGNRINEERNANGDTALYIAAANGNVDILRVLLNAGAKVNQTRGDGVPTSSISFRVFRVVRFMELEQKRRVGELDKDGGTVPLHIAAFRGHVGAIEILLGAGAEVDQPTNGSLTSLHIAAAEGQVNAISALLKAGAKIDKPTNSGLTPIHLAAFRGRVEVIQFLLKAGLKVDQPSASATTISSEGIIYKRHRRYLNWERVLQEGGLTPIYVAAFGGHVDAIQFLLNAGAKVDQSTNLGFAPIHAAALGGHVDAIQFLLNAGAKIDQCYQGGRYQENGLTPFHFAVLSGHVGAVELLLKAGAKVDEPFLFREDDKTGVVTPLCFVVMFAFREEDYKENYLDIFKALLKAGAKADQSFIFKDDGKESRMPLLCNIMFWEEDRVDVVEALLKAGAKVNEPALLEGDDKMNVMTPLFAAMFRKHMEIIKILLSYGADVHFKIRVEIEEESLLDMAKSEEEYTEIVKLFEEHIKSQNNHSLENVSRKTDLTPVTNDNGPFLTQLQLPVNPDKSVDILQTLQTQLEKQEEPTTSDTVNYSSAILIVMLDSLQTLRIEQQQLRDTTTRALQMQAQSIQQTLQKELNTQNQQWNDLQNEQQTLRQQMLKLQQGQELLAPGQEQQQLLVELGVVQRQLTEIEVQQAILWNEYEVNAQKRKTIQQFQGHPNLLLFYRTVYIKLEEIFISFKAVAGGFVDPVEGNVATAKSVLEFFGDYVSLVPLLGQSVDKILKWTVGKALEKVDSARQNNTAINASALVTLSEVKKYAESIARQLTERYTEQLLCLVTPEEEQTSVFQKGIQKVKKIGLKSQHFPPAKQLAAFGVIWMINQLYEAHQIDSQQSLEVVLMSTITQRKPPDKIQTFWNAVTTHLKIEGLLTKQGERWHPEHIYTLPGIKTLNGEYYAGDEVQPEKYGWRFGTTQDAERLGLKRVPVPINQTNTLQHQKITQSISLVRQDVLRHEAELEKIGKTRQIVESARVRVLVNDALEKEKEALKKEFEERERTTQQRLKQLEKAMLTPTTSSSPTNLLLLSRTRSTLTIGSRISRPSFYVGLPPLDENNNTTTEKEDPLAVLVNQTIQQVFKLSGISLSANYYHAHITRETVEVLLSQQREPGMFLIRSSAQNNGIVISYVDNHSQIAHSLLTEVEGQRFIPSSPHNNSPMSLYEFFQLYTKVFTKPLVTISPRAVAQFKN